MRCCGGRQQLQGDRDIADASSRRQAARQLCHSTVDIESPADLEDGKTFNRFDVGYQNRERSIDEQDVCGASTVHRSRGSRPKRRRRAARTPFLNLPIVTGDRPADPSSLRLQCCAVANKLYPCHLINCAARAQANGSTRWNIGIMLGNVAHAHGDARRISERWQHGSSIAPARSTKDYRKRNDLRVGFFGLGSPQVLTRQKHGPVTGPIRISASQLGLRGDLLLL